GDRDRSRLSAYGAAETREGVERGERGPRRTLRTLSADRSLGPGRTCVPRGSTLVPGERPLPGAAGRGLCDDAEGAALHLATGVDDAVPVRGGGECPTRGRHRGDRERDENLRAHASPSIEWHTPVIALRFARECDRAGTATHPRRRGFKSRRRMPINPRWLSSAWQTTPASRKTARTRSRKHSRPPTCSVASRARSPSISTS